MPVVSIQTAEHYTWGEACDGWHLLQGPNLHVIREAVPPGISERRHVHRDAQQFFFILSGQAVMEMDGADHHLSPGDGIHIPPGIPHQFNNPFESAVEFLVISNPTARGDRTDLS
jgi:mannose-6-phosphate isomerase-like protein (cupin superfamily)